MNKEPRIRNKYILHSLNGIDYKIIIININDCRPPEMKYGLDVWDNNNVYIGDIIFVGDDFFDIPNIELVEETNESSN